MNKSYATDCEWSKYITLLFIINVIQSIMLVITILMLYANFSNNKPDEACSGYKVFTSPMSLCMLVNAVGIILLLV